MKINFNRSAVFANNSLTRSDNKLQECMARLSSGLKIVNAKDNPSGLAMSKRMNAQIEGINQATNNAGDAISVIEIADGTLGEIHDMLQRLNELSVKSATGVLTENDRQMIDEEAQHLKEEISRIASEAEFNGQRIMDGSFDLRGYTSDPNVKVDYYSDQVKSGTYSLDITGVVFALDGTINPAASAINVANDANNGNPPYAQIPDNIEVSDIDGNVITIKGSQNFEMKLRVTGNVDNPVKLDILGFGSMDMQIGANEGQQLDIRIPKVSLENMGILSLDLTTQEGGLDAIDRVDNAIKYISAVRAGLGAYQNRLEHTINALDITSENMTAAYSRIMDADMAEEMTEYTTLQVLSQAGTSMLAQANERPSQVLQLLQ